MIPQQRLHNNRNSAIARCAKYGSTLPHYQGFTAPNAYPVVRLGKPLGYDRLCGSDQPRLRSLTIPSPMYTVHSIAFIGNKHDNE